MAPGNTAECQGHEAVHPPVVEFPGVLRKLSERLQVFAAISL